MFSKHDLSQNLNKLPPDISNYHIINQLSKDDLYQLRLVNKDALNFTSKTLAGGFMKNMAAFCPSSVMRWVLKCDYEPSRDIIVGAFASSLINGFVNSAILALCYQDFSVWNATSCLPVISLLAVPSALSLIVHIIVSPFLKNEDLSLIAPYIIFLYIGGVMFTQSIGSALNSNSKAFFGKNDFFSDSAHQSIFAQLSNIKLFGVNMLTVMEAIPLATWTGYRLFGMFKQKSVKQTKERLSKQMTEAMNIKLETLNK